MTHILGVASLEAAARLRVAKPACPHNVPLLLCCYALYNVIPEHMILGMQACGWTDTPEGFRDLLSDGPTVIMILSLTP